MKRTVRTYLPLLAIVVLGSTLRLYQIGAQGLWIDEAFSIWLARHPWTEMVRWVASVDQHPPLYYTLLTGWMRVFGDGEASTRALSALLGTLTLPVAYVLGRHVADEGVGLLSALILAVSPFHVQFGQEARMYALLALSGSLALYAGMRLLGGDHRVLGSGQAGDRRVGSWMRGGKEALPWIGYVVFTATMLWTHNAAVFFPLALNLYALGRSLVERRSDSPASLPADGPARWRRNWLLAQVAVLILWLPWLPTFVSQAAGVYRRFWLPAPTVETVLSLIGEFLCAFLPLSPAGIVAVALALVAVLLLGLGQLRHRRAETAVLGLVFTVPLAGECIVSLWRPILYARTLIWASIPVYLILATGLRAIEVKTSSRAYLLAALVIALAANGLALHNYYQDFEKEAWDDAAAHVAQHVQPGDLLLFSDAWGQIPFDYYFRQLYNRPVVEHGLPVDLFDRGVLEPTMTEDDLPRMRTLIDEHDRVWLVSSHEFYTDPRGLVPRALEDELFVLDRWEFYRLRVSLYGHGAGWANEQR